MRANDEFDPPISATSFESTAEPASRPQASTNKDADRMVVRVVNVGRLPPLPYPDPLAEYEEMFGPIDVHSLNLPPGEESFTVLAKVEHLGWMAPLPYPDPLGDREDEVGD